MNEDKKSTPQEEQRRQERVLAWAQELSNRLNETGKVDAIVEGGYEFRLDPAKVGADDVGTIYNPIVIGENELGYITTGENGDFKINVLSLDDGQLINQTAGHQRPLHITLTITDHPSGGQTVEIDSANPAERLFVGQVGPAKHYGQDIESGALPGPVMGTDVSLPSKDGYPSLWGSTNADNFGTYGQHGLDTTSVAPYQGRFNLNTDWRHYGNNLTNPEEYMALNSAFRDYDNAYYENEVGPDSVASQSALAAANNNLYQEAQQFSNATGKSVHMPEGGWMNPDIAHQQKGGPYYGPNSHEGRHTPYGYEALRGGLNGAPIYTPKPTTTPSPIGVNQVGEHPGFVAPISDPYGAVGQDWFDTFNNDANQAQRSGSGATGLSVYNNTAENSIHAQPSNSKPQDNRPWWSTDINARLNYPEEYRNLSRSYRDHKDALEANSVGPDSVATQSALADAHNNLRQSAQEFANAAGRSVDIAGDDRVYPRYTTIPHGYSGYRSGPGFSMPAPSPASDPSIIGVNQVGEHPFATKDGGGQTVSVPEDVMEKLIQGEITREDALAMIDNSRQLEELYSSPLALGGQTIGDVDFGIESDGSGPAAMTHAEQIRYALDRQSVINGLPRNPVNTGINEHTNSFLHNANVAGGPEVSAAAKIAANEHANARFNEAAQDGLVATPGYNPGLTPAAIDFNAQNSTRLSDVDALSAPSPRLNTASAAISAEQQKETRERQYAAQQAVKVQQQAAAQRQKQIAATAAADADRIARAEAAQKAATAAAQQQAAQKREAQRIAALNTTKQTTAPRTTTAAPTVAPRPVVHAPSAISSPRPVTPVQTTPASVAPQAHPNANDQASHLAAINAVRDSWMKPSTPAASTPTTSNTSVPHYTPTTPTLTTTNTQYGAADAGSLGVGANVTTSTGSSGTVNSSLFHW